MRKPPSFERSFASHPRSACWSDKNELKPREVYKKSDNVYLFNCDVCPHDFKMALSGVSRGYWCLYCVSKMLCTKECKTCFNKSFSSVSRSTNWSKKNKTSARLTFKKSGKKIYFNCPCGHEFGAILHNISILNNWCPYCAARKLCNKDCIMCHNNSFASYSKAGCWSKRNKIGPRSVLKFTKKKFWLICPDCKKEFYANLNCVTHRDTWCGKCKFSQLEKKVCKFLDKFEIEYIEQKKFNDLKNKAYLPFDFYIPSLKCLIEVDGGQHFKFVKFFHKTQNGFKKRVNTDIKKNYYAISNGYHLLRISYLEIHLLEAYLSLFIRKVRSSNSQTTMFSNPKLYKETYLHK